MIRIDPRPDFSRFLDVLLLRRAYRRPPLFDFHIHPAHKALALGKEINTPADDVAFYRAAGYDFVQCTIHVFSQEVDEAVRRTKGSAASMGENLGIITDLAQYRSRRWSWQPAAEGDLSCIARQLDRLKGLIDALPPSMKILLHGADVFTIAWQLIGFEAFCLKTIEEPELIEQLMDSLARAQLNALTEAARIAGSNLGAIFYSDDIAYTEGLFLGPAFYRQYLFPVLKRVAQIGQQYGAPMIFHSDGRLYDVFDDLWDAGVRGIQPLEPKSMDPLEIKRRWPGKFCLIGNIDLDLMSRGTERQVEQHVRQRVESLNEGGPYKGGYMPGVSNTVPHYVNYENYKRMIETVYSFPDDELK